VSVGIGRRVAGGRCRFLTTSGSFGKPVSCQHPGYLRASGTAHWRLRLANRLPRGRYVAWARAVDAAGNVERRAPSRNMTTFAIR
jgi:hypothetical protein